MKQIYDLLVYPLSVVENPFLDFLLLSIIGSLAFIIAWNIVNITGIRGKFGSILHWTVRFFIMIVLCFLTSVLFKFLSFLQNHLLISSIFFIVSILFVCIIKIYKYKTRNNL